MGKQWQLQDAKNRFSEVVNRAQQDGPQTVTRRGEPTVVVISVDEYRRLTQRKTNFYEFLRQSPLVGVELDLERAKDLPREVDL